MKTRVRIKKEDLLGRGLKWINLKGGSMALREIPDIIEVVGEVKEKHVSS